MLKVAKFGGSSMADAKQYQKVKDIILSDPSRKAVVVSAAGKRFSGDHKLTDLLYLCHAHLQYGVDAGSVFQMIRDRYTEIRDELKLNVDLEADFDALWQKMQSGISQDELVSRGEYFSAKLMAAYLGFTFVDAARWLTFQTDGSINEEASYAALAQIAAGKCVVIPGFYGVMADGSVHIMERGGSDITGALVAAALDADVYENWTDVSGILMADPRIVKDAQTIKRVTYSELRELSYIGAQVLHEATIFPVREKNIPLNIRNTNDPSHPGTMIRETFDDAVEDGIITGIAGKKDFVIITVTKSGLSSRPDSIRKIMEVFEKYGVCVSYAPSGIDCFSTVVEAARLASCRYAVLADLEKSLKPDKIDVSENIAVVAVVGRKMASRAGTSAKIFDVLGKNNINIRMISQGPEELNIIIGVNNDDFAPAIRMLYQSFAK